MKKQLMRSIRYSCSPFRWGMVLSLWLTLHLADAAAGSGQAVEIKLGETIERSWHEVVEDNYAYAPKQDFEMATNETHIWLPYGSSAPYYEVSGLHLIDPVEDTGTPMFVTVDGNTSGKLVMKLRFDKPITSFRLFAGWSEWGMKSGTVGGVEYSTDGQNWKTIRQIDKGGIIERFADPDTAEVKGLKTRNLYLRFYSRGEDGSENQPGGHYWMKFRTAGDPSWGDAHTTFFQQQFQLWVTEA